jgi:dTDP-4-dehydrorhamnose reductase
MLKLLKEKEQIAVVSDQIGSPTYAKDLANVILKVLPQLNNKGFEVYHYTNAGKCSWYEFANEIKAFTKSTCKINSVTSEAFKAKATRPKFSLLNTEKIEKEYKIEIPFWKDSLKECLIKMNEL